MANMREIRSRIKSIIETKQITKAMKLISAAKLRKARNQLQQAFPYFDKVKTTMADIIMHSENITNRYFACGELKENPTRAYIIITGDKGMAGAYNHNVVKLAEKLASDDEKYRFYVIGQVGRHHFMRNAAPIEEGFDFSVQNPTIYLAREVTEYLLDDFKNGLIDEVYVIYTFMRSAFKLEPTVMKLLPLDIGSFERTEVTEGDTKFGMQYTLFYLPTPEAVLESLVPKYVKGIVYGALVESFTSENSARMTAMENATTNADKMLEKLRMFYNRTRQAVITQEISEIIGGANMIDE